MVAGLGNTQVIGGGSVVITCDLTQLRSQLATLPQLVAAAVKPILLPVQLNVAGLQAQIAALTPRLAATPVNLTVNIPAAQIQAQFANLMRQLQQQANQLQIPANTPANAPGGGGGGGGAGGGFGGGRSGLGGIGRITSTMALIRDARQLARIISDHSEAVTDAESPEEINKADIRSIRETDQVGFGIGRVARAAVEQIPGTTSLEERERVAREMKISDRQFSHDLGRAGTEGRYTEDWAKGQVKLGRGPESKRMLADATIETSTKQGEIRAKYAKEAMEIAKERDAIELKIQRGEISGSGEGSHQRGLNTVRKDQMEADRQRDLEWEERLYKQKVAEAKITEQEEKIHHDSGQATLTTRYKVASLREDAVSRMVAGGGTKEDVRKADQLAEREELKDKQRRETEGQRAYERDHLGGKEDTAGRSNLEKAQAAERRELRAKQGEEDEKQEQETQSRIKGIVAGGQAATLQAEHKGFEARMKIFEAAAAKRIAAVRHESAKEDEAVRESIKQERAAMIKEDAEKETRQASVESAHGKAALLKATHRDFEGRMLDFKTGQQARIDAMEEGPAKEAAKQSLVDQTKAMRIEHAEQIFEQTRSLDAETTSSQDTRRGYNLSARAATSAASALNRVQSSPMELREKTIQAELAKLQEEHGTAMFDPGSDYFSAKHVDNYHLKTATPFQLKDQKVAGERYDRAIDTLRKQRDKIRADAKAGAHPGGEGKPAEDSKNLADLLALSRQWFPKIGQNGYQ